MSIESVLEGIRGHVLQDGDKNGKVWEANSKRISQWIPFLKSIQTATSPPLDAIQDSLYECKTYCQLGLALAAAGAQRRTLELVPIWIVLRDNPLKWRRRNMGTEPFLLRKAAENEISATIPWYSNAWKALESTRKRTVQNPYAVLSKVAHAQSPTLWSSLDIEASIVNREWTSEVLALQIDVDEYLSDMLVARFAGNWALLPSNIRREVEGRLGDDKVASLITLPSLGDINKMGDKG